MRIGAGERREQRLEAVGAGAARVLGREQSLDRGGVGDRAGGLGRERSGRERKQEAERNPAGVCGHGDPKVRGCRKP